MPVTMEGIILKREDVATRRERVRKAGECGEMILRGSRGKQRIIERSKKLIR
jgi:hypothetical protein